MGVWVDNDLGLTTPVAVPEGGSAGLMLVGLVVAGAVRRWRRVSSSEQVRFATDQTVLPASVNS